MVDLAGRIEIANPQQPHCACVLLLDTSGSMGDDNKIGQLNDGLRVFCDELPKDDLAAKRVDLAVITFGEGVRVLQEFTSIDGFAPPFLTAGGVTPMGEAILLATEMAEQRKQEYRQRGVDYYRPWIFMITDGDPTDMRPGDAQWNKVVQAVNDGETKKKFLFWSVAVQPANIDMLKQLAPRNRAPARLKPGCFKELFRWLSNSMTRVSTSRVGEQVALEAPSSWLQIEA